MRPCVFFTCYCPSCEKSRFNDKVSLRQVLCSILSKKKKKEKKKNARILSAILLFAYSWKLTPLQNKGKNIKDFNFYNNADEMEKSTSVLETAYYFFEKEDVTVVDVDIGYVQGRSNNIIAVD